MIRAAAVGLLSAAVVALLLEMRRDYGGNKNVRVGLLCLCLGVSVLVLLRKNKTSTG